ncbi:hypothetical protein AB6A40_000326 [Gnathostoma spinigerum]|uniref:INTS8 TPR repeats domain-containing protein n=1 Tax=Gnathostoma spinigerum TaxID=75299 RepID=A0ABD6E3Z1_9BILA
MNTLNFLFEKPVEDWIDHFINKEKFLSVLNSSESDLNHLAHLAQLVNQFTEQALAVDKEVEAQIQKEIDEEDVGYTRRKASKLWLCALACCAATGWNIELIKKHCNVLVLRAVLGKLLLFCFPDRGPNVEKDVIPEIFNDTVEIKQRFCRPEQIFSTWLYAKWIVQLDVTGRFPEPVAKPTVSNPLNQYDANLILADQFRVCIAELRLRTPDALKLLERLLNEVAIDVMPIVSKESFTEDLFKENNLDQPTASLLDAGPLQTSLPHPHFRNFDGVESLNWRTHTCYDLLCDRFAAGDFVESRNYLRKIIEAWPNVMALGKMEINQAMTNEMNEAIINGYCVALGLRPLAKSDEQLFTTERFFYSEISEKTIDHLSLANQSLLRRSECYRIASTSSAPFSCELLAENAVEEYRRGISASAFTLAKINSSNGGRLRLAKSLVKLMDICHENDGLRLKFECIIEFLMGACPAFAADIRKVEGEHVHHFKNILMKILPRRSKTVTPDAAAIKDLLSGGTDLWKLIVSNDVSEIRSIVSSMATKFNNPYRIRPSRMIGEAVFKTLPPSSADYIMFLLGKLEQFAKVGNYAHWSDFVSGCVVELGPIGKSQDVKNRLLYDAIRVRLDTWHNRYCRCANTSDFQQFTSALLDNVKAILPAAASMNPPPPLAHMMLQTVAFLINTLEWDFLRKIQTLKLAYYDFILDPVAGCSLS